MSIGLIFDTSSWEQVAEIKKRSDLSLAAFEKSFSCLDRSSMHGMVRGTKMRILLKIGTFLELVGEMLKIVGGILKLVVAHPSLLLHLLQDHPLVHIAFLLAMFALMTSLMIKVALHASSALIALINP